MPMGNGVGEGWRSMNDGILVKPTSALMGPLTI